ncbi:MAG: hypothetical protein KF817_07680 [Phycisphaeraceae bacterium]|nr:hypothetical protein [Phycisphaeraceae bacterium]
MSYPKRRLSAVLAIVSTVGLLSGLIMYAPTQIAGGAFAACLVNDEEIWIDHYVTIAPDSIERSAIIENDLLTTWVIGGHPATSNGCYCRQTGGRNSNVLCYVSSCAS